MVIFVGDKEVLQISWQQYLLLRCRQELIYKHKIIEYQDSVFELWLEKKSIQQILNILKDYENSRGTLSQG